MMRLAACAVLLSWAVPAALPAQTRSLLDFYREGRTPLTRDQAQAAARERADAAARATGALPPLEGAVDAGAYLVGPNDVFGVSIGGIEPFHAQVTVSADGHLTLPGSGAVYVAGETLDAVRRRATTVLRENFENVPVDVTLLQPRAFFVHVAGAVPAPGRYPAAPVARVEDVVRAAFFAPTADEPVADPSFRPALRNVRVTGRDGSVRTVDLVRYYRTGEVAHNPYVRDGDAITVPAYRPAEQGVFVGGRVPFPGTYDHRPGDSVLDLLAVAGRAGGGDGGETVRLTRRTAGGATESWEFRLADLAAPGAAGAPVRPGDNVSLPEPDAPTGVASVVGHVRFPGAFAIDEGRTTLRELVNMAGGLRADALVRGAYLERGEALLARPAPAPDPATGAPVLVTDTSSVLRRMRLSDLDFLSRYDLARALQLDNRVSVDVGRALADGAEPVPLYDGDRLVVPRDERSVRVIGEVVRPGAVGLLASDAARAYVRAAGGPGPAAGGTYVIRAGTGQVVSGDGTPVSSGDVVFVDRRGSSAATPEQERIALQERDVGIRKFQLVLQTVGTVLTVVTTTLLVADAIRN